MNPYTAEQATQGIPAQSAPAPQMAPYNPQNYQQQMAQALMNQGQNGQQDLTGVMNMLAMQKQNPQIYGGADTAQQVGGTGGFTLSGSTL